MPTLYCRYTRHILLASTTEVAKQAEQILRADPDVFGTFAVPGFSLTGGSSSNYGLIFAPLKPIDDRKGKRHARRANLQRKGHAGAGNSPRRRETEISGRDHPGRQVHTGHQAHRGYPGYRAHPGCRDRRGD